MTEQEAFLIQARSDFRVFQLLMGQFLKKAAPIFREIDELNPSVGTQKLVDSKYSQPNVEYPWQARNSESEVVWHAPAGHHWRLIESLRTSDGAKVLQFIETLIERFDVIFH